MSYVALGASVLALLGTWRWHRFLRQEAARQRAERGQIMRDRLANLALLQESLLVNAQSREFLPSIESDLEPGDPR